jgi:TolB-like protein/Flp pilus assembly protein TadD
MESWIEARLSWIRVRQLDRLAAAYAVGGWLLVQAASIALPAFDAPGWALRWLIVATVVGFPFALTVGAVLNKGTDGRALAVGGREAIFLAVVGLVAVLTLGELAWHWSATSSATGPASDLSAPPGSVAVLPFDNMSDDPRERYFSEGISDELIGLLARNPSLRVAARTSSFFFEGKSQDIRSIAQKLNVRSILEGSVRQDGTRVRIEASLVNAADGYQLWSQSYDRSLRDILTVQAEIAQSIAQALAPTLTGKPSVPRLPKPTQLDPQVYRDYLQAQFYFDQRLTEGQTPASRSALEQAVMLFRKVAAVAPDFADGQASLARALIYVEKDSELDDEIGQALRRALTLDPDNPQALLVAIETAEGRWDWDGVIKNAALLKRSSEHTAVGAQGLADVYAAFAVTDKALDKYREWARLDPYSNAAWQGVARSYFVQARYADAVNAANEALALHPDDPVTLEYKCVSLANLKRLPEAKAVLTLLSAPGVPVPLTTHCKFFVTLNSDGPDRAIAVVNDVLEHDPGNAGPTGDVGFMLSHAGAFDQAMDWYEKSFVNKDFVFGFYPGQSTPAAFVTTPRWIALTQRPEYQRWLAARARVLSGI